MVDFEPDTKRGTSNTEEAKTPRWPTRRFSEETRKSLESYGYLVYELSGASIKQLRETGKPFWTKWHEEYPGWEGERHDAVQVALNSENFFLENSNWKKYREQETMVEDFSRQLTMKIPGVFATIGAAPHYSELAFAHFDKTGKRLFGKEQDYCFTRTRSYVGDSHYAVVGRFFEKGNAAGEGISVDHYPVYDGNGHIWVAPLIVPDYPA